MTRVVQKKDTLALLPTGGGKSLCYQIPALIFPGVTLVVSPLISLMKDQVQQLDQAGISAVALNSSLTPEAYRAQADRIRSGGVKLVYAAPETLMTPRFLDLMSGVPVDCLTVDEAHCVSEWGHDFRPEYRRIAELRPHFPQAVILALTATATARVRQDILQSLRLQEPREYVAGFDRPNLHLSVASKTEGRRQLVEFLERHPGESGIVYCASRKQVEDLGEYLGQNGYRVRPYHAGLPDVQRSENQELFLRDDIDIIVATLAFGMGINKSNVRFVCHYDLPKSLENYYQEIGRAGRDGGAAECLLLYSYGDAKKQEHFFREKEGEALTAARLQLKRMVDYCEASLCRRIPLLSYFGESFVPENPLGCGGCDNCLTPKKQDDLTVPVQKFLSCVLRTGERFGAGYVIQVLLGAETEAVLGRGHQSLSTWGIGKEWSSHQWQNLVQQISARGLVARDEYQGLSLTPSGRNFLKNRESFFGFFPLPPPGRQKGQKKDRKGLSSGSEVRPEGGLFEVLRKVRKALADQAGVPPFMVFSDRTLADMVEKRPRTREAFQEVFGVGVRKAQAYGEAFLQAVRDYESS